MTNRKEIRLRYFEQSAGQQHITAEDHYLYAAPKPTLNFVIIGCGTIGQEHLRVTQLLGKAKVHGLFDEQEKSLALAQESLYALSGERARSYKTLEEACQDSEIDAYIIATPNHTHRDVLREVMASGKPILLEKPMATTLADAAEIVTMCNSYAAHVQVGLQYRFKAIYTEATHEILERRSIGEVKTLHLIEHRPPFLDKVKQWNKFSKNTGGTLIEKCCHYFDLFNHYAQALPIRVYASGSQAVNFKDFEYAGEKSDIMDNAMVIIDYDNGVRANFELNMFAPNFHEEMIVCGDGGRLTARETFNVFQTQESESFLQVEHAEPYATRHVDVAYPSFIEQSGHHGATYFEHIAFCDAIAGKPSVAADITQGFWSIVVGAAAQESADTGQVVRIDEFLSEHNLDEFLESE